MNNLKTSFQIAKKLASKGFATNDKTGIFAFIGDRGPTPEVPLMARVTIEVRRNQVEVIARDVQGDLDYDKTEQFQSKISKALGWTGGYRTGYGSWILSPVGGPDASHLTGKADPMHY